jgi:hypothetical protein
MNKVSESEASNRHDSITCSSTDQDDHSTSSDSSEDDQEYPDVEEDQEDIIKIKGLFSAQLFDNVQDLFKHEFEHNKFNLVDVITRYKMSMMDYIKMINFIRVEV